MAHAPTAGRARRATPWRLLSLLLVLALALRVAVIIAPPPELFERGGVPHEELLRGVATKELIDGALAPLQDYQINHFWGGSLVMSFLAIPTFAVLGPTVVAMRLPSVLFGVSAVLLAFLVLDRFATRRAAWIAAWLMALAPPGYAILSCTVYGTHLESNALALGLMLLYLEWRARNRSGWLRSACFGAACGFSLWFGYGLMLVLAAVLVLELASDKLFFARKPYLYVLAGFVVGFVPWIRYMATHPGHAGDVYDISIARHFEIGIERGTAGEKLFDFFSRDWPESFWFQRTFGVDGMWLGRFVELALVVLVARAAWAARTEMRALLRPRARATPAAFALIFLAFFFAAYCLSDFVVGTRDVLLHFRYLMPAWPMVALLAALGADELMRTSSLRARRATVGVAIALPALFAAGTLLRCDTSKASANWTTPAHSFEYLVRFLLLHFGSDANQMDGVVARIESTRSPAEQERLYRAFAAGLSILARVSTDADEIARERARHHREMLEHLAERVAPEFRGLFVDAAGKASRQ